MKKIFYYFIIIIATLVVILSVLSLVYNLTPWYSKALDFPRVQYLITAAVCLALFVLIKREWRFASVFLVSGLLAAIAIQSVRILPYYVADKSVPEADSSKLNRDNKVGILLANVLIDNRSSDEFLKIVHTTDPDMVLVMEVVDWWVQQLQPLREAYPHVMEYPLDNAYGMTLYSRMPLENEEIKFLSHDDVPSFHADVRLRSGKKFRFHGVHPVAPIPSKKYPDNKNEDEVALLKIGRMVASDSMATVVAGDFNDVSWSKTSRLFGNSGNLNNVRIGRGIYNTFDAQSVFMRWPLDHCFVSDEFACSKLERLPKFNSDHFPLYVELVLEDR